MRLINLLFVILIPVFGFQQTNTTLLGQIDIPTLHSTELNDVWGYTDETGKEYALVGAQDGTSVVDITNSSSPTEIFWEPGLNSTWRDLKTFGDYAYVTTEAQQGLLIINLTSLPNASGITASYFNGPTGNPWQSAHNLYIDENGFMYIFGANRGNGGVLIYDLNTSATNPTEVGDIDNWYVHDGFVQNDTGYFGNIYEGFFSSWDVTDKSTPEFIGSALTPTTFTHNIWATGNNMYAFTTDEVAGGYIGAYDLTNPTNPMFIDKIQSSPGDNIIPHNTHVKGDYIYTSYYADGLVIHNVSNPDNMVEVGRYDTSPLSSSEFVGCWGVYPYFSSGKILATDIEEGLFIIDVDLKQGSYLKGEVTEIGSGIPVSNTEVTIEGTLIEDFSNVFGNYATGIYGNETKDVTFFKVLYFPETISVNFQEGLTVVEDVELERIPQYDMEVIVLDANTNNPIENANVVFEHQFIDHSGTTNADGEVVIDLYYQDLYQINVGKWGYETQCITDTLLTSAATSITIFLEPGYYDDFTFDFGWDTIHTGVKSGWVRDIPVGVEKNGFIQNPFNDIGWDCGKYAYLTGNGSDLSNTDEVDQGEAILLSPIMDLSTYTSPHVNYALWYFNKYGSTPPNDTLFIYMNNGVDQVLIDFLAPETATMSQWIGHSVSLNDKITVTNTMQLIVYISDYIETININDAGLDFFSVTDFSVLYTPVNISEKDKLLIYPNPFNDVVYISQEYTEVMIYDFTGKLVYHAKNQIQMDLSLLTNGFYLIKVKDFNGDLIKTEKLIKN
jgi:choice-of-anchor B domain-containing protein